MPGAAGYNGLGTTNFETSEVDSSGAPVGVVADSPWLLVAPWGFRKALKYLHDRWELETGSWKVDGGGGSLALAPAHSARRPPSCPHPPSPPHPPTPPPHPPTPRHLAALSPASSYGFSEIAVTENGVSVPGEDKAALPDVLHDKFRVDFYDGYVRAAADAVTQDGVPLTTYFAWSLLDNFEW